MGSLAVVLVILAALVVFCLLFVRRIITPCPGCVLESVHQSGGSASYDTIVRWIDAEKRGKTDLSRLKVMLQHLEEEGKLSLVMPSKPQDFGGTSVGIYFLTEAGQEAQRQHAAVPHL